jgi:hypothetical protein
MENARCELFPGSPNGRLIVEARKVKHIEINQNSLLSIFFSFLIGRLSRSSIYFSSFKK